MFEDENIFHPELNSKRCAKLNCQIYIMILCLTYNGCCHYVTNNSTKKALSRSVNSQLGCRLDF